MEVIDGKLQTQKYNDQMAEKLQNLSEINKILYLIGIMKSNISI